MSARRALAVTVWATSWALAIASLVVRWLADLPSAPLEGVFLSPAPQEMQARFDDIGVAVALVYGPVSAIILARRPHPVGVILAVHAIGSGLAAFGFQWGLWGAQNPELPLWGLLAFAAGWGFVPGTFMTAALPLLVLRGRVPRWQGAVVIVCALVSLLAFIASLTQQSVETPVNPLAISVDDYQRILPATYTALSFIAVAISIVSCAVLVSRWMRARGRARTGLAWLTLGHAFLTASYVALVMPSSVEIPRAVVDFGLVAPVLGQLLYPAAILVVVLGQRLWGVEIVVSRVILWASLTLSGVALYVVVVLIVPILDPDATGVGLAVPLLIAIAVQPLRRWLQRRIDRLIYGEGADPAALLARLGDRIGELDSGEAGLRELSDALRRVLRLGSVSITSHRSALSASVGEALGPATSLDLFSGQQRIGELIVRPPEGQRLDRRTLSVLDDVAGLVAAALQLIESSVVLEEARAELVSLRAEERRAIRRQLHDGLGPALAGIGFGLAAVENLMARDRVKATALLHELVDDVNRRVRDVRELASEVTPSPLDGATLAEALGELAQRFTTPSLRVTTAVDMHVDVPRPTQDAVFFIAAEAMTNAVRHAAARTVEVQVSTRDGGVHLAVSDDGVGFGTSTPTGVGLTSMRERAEGLHGSLEVSSGSHGTRVTAMLPAESVVTIEDKAP